MAKGGDEGRNDFMKVALVHDYIKEYGGAEKVLEALHEVFPQASVFTTVYLPKYLGPHQERFKDWDIRTSWLQHIPFKAKLISPFRLIAPFVFKQFDFSTFDVVVVSATGAYSPNGIANKNQESRIKNYEEKKKEHNHTPSAIRHKPIHVCYCHTPPRYLYGYPTAREWKNNPVMLVLGTITNHFLRMVDVKSSENVDYFVANSEEVKARIKKFYRKDATVIYPPVDLEGSRWQVARREKNNHELRATSYYLAGSRLARAKHIDLLIKAAKKYNLALKVFGKGFAGYEEELKKLAGGASGVGGRKGNIEFVGEVSDEQKYELMRNAKAYLFASEYEDFGITPVEAMGQGTPVVAYRSGGVKETLIDGKTGVFFDELTVESVKDALDKLEKISIKSEDCVKQAEKFNSERFKKEIKAFVNKLAI